ncbi:MAG: hypothetical protein WBQ68_16230, partial [Terriglobales bacterium]
SLIQAGALQAGALQASAQSSPDNSPHSMQQDSQPPSLASSLNNGERKITGCIRSEKGKYALEKKGHKKVWLSGPEDFAPHAGHTVILYGTYLNGSTPANSGQADPNKASQPSASRQETNFQVTKVEMVSDTCSVNTVKASDHP